MLQPLLCQTLEPDLKCSFCVNCVWLDGGPYVHFVNPLWTHPMGGGADDDDTLYLLTISTLIPDPELILTINTRTRSIDVIFTLSLSLQTAASVLNHNARRHSTECGVEDPQWHCCSVIFSTHFHDRMLLGRSGLIGGGCTP